MSLITSRFHQTAVLWPQSGSAPDKFGQPVVVAPVQIQCRWVKKIREFIDKNGTRQMSSATVYPDRPLFVGDLIMLGTLASVAYPNVPKSNPGVWEVRDVTDNLDFSGNETSHTVLL